MNLALQELADHYQTELLDYLAQSGEAGLRGAYELGRKAIGEGLGVLELAGIHQRCLAAILSHLKEDRERQRVMKAGAEFLAECLSPFEMALRGFQEANATLRRNLDELLAAEEELCQQNQKLAAAHQAVAAERQRYRELFEFAPDGYVVTDLQAYVQEANSAATALFEAGDLAGSWLLPFVAPEDRPVFEALLPRIVSSEGEGAIEAEMSMRAGGGRMLPVLVKISLVRGPDGQPAGLLWLLRDVTERKRVEEERALLQIRERVARAEAEGARRLEFLAEASKLLAASLDYEATFGSVARLVVPYLADWCYFHIVEEAPAGSAAESVLRPLPGAFAEPLSAADLEEIERLREARQQPPEVVRKVVQSGTSELFSSLTGAALARLAGGPDAAVPFTRLGGAATAMVVPLIAQSRALGTITFLSVRQGRRYGASELILAEDLAHRCALALDNAHLYRQANIERERAERASRAKDEFVAILSHELRNPLMPIVGWARVFKNQPAMMQDTLLSEGVRSLERNAQNIERIVEDCLDLSRITERKIRLEREVLDLNQVAEAAIEAVRELANARSIQFVVQLSGAPLRVWGDRTRLQQVVMNLLTNSIRYTESGGVVSLRSQWRDGHVEIAVSDTGIGIARDFIEQIFEPFRQGSRSWLAAESGLGLGLAVVKQIVEMHGGVISAESEGPGRGSTFRVRLPVAAQPAAQPADDRPQPGAVPVHSLRVLIIEDTRDILSLMKIELEALGYSVLTAADGKAGLDIALRCLPDVIVSDIKMPGMDGYELIRRIRQTPALAHVPAVALTGFGMKKDVQRAIDAGFNAHVVKPVDPIRLSALLHELSNKQSA